MFTDIAQSLIDLAKDYAFAAESKELDLNAVLTAVGAGPRSGLLLADCLGWSPGKLAEACPRMADPKGCPGKMPLSAEVKMLLTSAKELANEVPDRQHPGLIDVQHLVCSLALSKEACAIIKSQPMSRLDAVKILAGWYEMHAQAPRLDELMDKLRKMRGHLLSKVFGQDHAVHAFVEGIFNAEVVATADTGRKSPRAVFVFAGPPGVGKTYLAESSSAYLERPFKRFDMTAYSGHEQNQQLAGWAKSYHAAHPGTLTEFVEKNPHAILLFDEIEKAHVNTIHLFLQILDAGTLEDKYHERNVTFRDTTIIFTTNAGRKLYDKPNETGVHRANASFHRKTILDALENERDPRTNQPFFPGSICSRIAAGYPVLFNHLGVTELERVARAEIERVGGLLERQYLKRVEFDDLLPLCLVLCEGSRVDARTLRKQRRS